MRASRSLLLLAFLLYGTVAYAAGHHHGHAGSPLPVWGALALTGAAGLAIWRRKHLPLVLGLLVLTHSPHGLASAKAAHQAPPSCCTLAKSTEPPPSVHPAARLEVVGLTERGHARPRSSEPSRIEIIRGPPLA